MDPTAHSAPCAHAASRVAEAPRAMAAAEALCRARGARLTAIRRDVLGALLATHRPMSAYDLIEALAPSGARRLAPVTVYRALDFLLAQGLVHRLASRNAFVACPAHHRPDESVAFLICERCGGVDEAASDELSGALARLAEAQGFRPRARVVELAGACAHCRADAHPA